MSKYYMIHKLDGTGSGPSKVHHTLDEAKAEAKRLAQKHIGDTFVILQSFIGLTVQPAEPTETSFE